MITHTHSKKTIPVLITFLLLVLISTGCGSNDEEQRYSWPLATASPEDTVTQIFLLSSKIQLLRFPS